MQHDSVDTDRTTDKELVKRVTGTERTLGDDLNTRTMSPTSNSRAASRRNLTTISPRSPTATSPMTIKNGEQILHTEEGE